VGKRRIGRAAPGPFAEPADTAQAAALHYASDRTPGIRRRRAGRGFVYVDRRGRVVRSAATLARIRGLVIPPAWTGVWITTDPAGHLQATGRDARGRKQYRYHQRWRAVRDETKYGRMAIFGAALPRIRRRIARDLRGRDGRDGSALPRERVLATVVRLLETTLIRVGNEEYARANNSYGLTTLKNHHVAVARGEILLRFRGKGGKAHDIRVSDRRLARLVRRIRDLPGHELFQYVDERGGVRSVTSGDVNAYLREASGEDFTAKDFRTWAGTLIAAQGLSGERPGGNGAAKRAVAAVAVRLGNTPAVCRKSYIYPGILAAYADRAARRRWMRTRRGAAAPRGLREDEASLLRFLSAAAGVSGGAPRPAWSRRGSGTRAPRARYRRGHPTS
jgi:DNA topoisomerase-1